MPQDKEKIHKLYKSAVENFDKGDLETAVKLFKKINTSQPELAFPYYYLGCSYFRMKEFEAAADYLAKAIQLIPLEDAYIKLGLSLGETGKTDASIGVFEDACRYFPDSADMRTYLGAALRAASRFEEAVSAFLDAVNLDSNHLGANWGLGVTYGMLGQIIMAEKQLKKTILLSPAFAPPRFYLALTYLSAGKYENAVEELLILEKLDASYASRLKKEINIYIESGFANQ